MVYVKLRLREDINKEANNLTTNEEYDGDQVEGEDGNGDKNRNEEKSERRAPFRFSVSALLLLLLNYLSSLSLSDLPLLLPGPTKLSYSGFAFGIPRIACCEASML